MTTSKSHDPPRNGEQAMTAHPMTLVEAEELVRRRMAIEEPGKVLDPEIVRFVAEVVVELTSRRALESKP
jgi:hypothetical protein